MIHTIDVQAGEVIQAMDKIPFINKERAGMVELMEKQDSVGFQGTLGLDAEFIIRSKATGLPVSMVDRLGGTKQNPLRVPRGALQEDGVLAEINIDPAHSLHEWHLNITTVLKELEARVGRMGCYVDYGCIEAEYPDSELQDFRAWESGCEPDYNFLTEDENPRPDFNGPMRTCGGHIHIGMPWGSYLANYSKFPVGIDFNFMLSLEILFGAGLYLLEPENHRRRLYGMPGSYRPKPYGVELRSPSSYWVANPRLRKYVWTLFSLMKSGSVNVSHAKIVYGLMHFSKINPYLQRSILEDRTYYPKKNLVAMAFDHVGVPLP